jgi:hypothetical protein
MKRYAVLFAMPVSRTAFMSAAQAVPLSDYMRNMLSNATAEDVWQRRYSEIADAAQALISALREWSVPTVEHATLHDLRLATLTSDVVVLFAHWCSSDSTTGQEGGRLELADGVHLADDIEAAIAADFTGTLDLSSCRSKDLASHIKRRRGDTVSTIFNTELLDPLPAYVVVRHLVEYCLRTGVDYRLARLQAAGDLRRNA